MPSETSIGGDNVRFQPTAWTIIRSAGEGSRAALDQLIAAYWKPAYFFIRRRGQDVESAKDLTQGFFGSLIERNIPGTADPERGSFRNYLLGALNHYLSDEQDRARAKKRGGDFNFVQAELDLASAEPTPEEAFRSRWAREILSRAMTRLRAEVPAEDLALLSGQLRPDLSVTDRKNRLFRLRAKLKESIRQVILPSVDRAEDVDSEIRHLLSAFS
jgi:RNA polymerase sigma-70 factor (ECF subfamily)